MLLWRVPELGHRYSVILYVLQGLPKRFTCGAPAATFQRHAWERWRWASSSWPLSLSAGHRTTCWACGTGSSQTIWSQHCPTRWLTCSSYLACSMLVWTPSLTACSPSTSARDWSAIATEQWHWMNRKTTQRRPDRSSAHHPPSAWGSSLRPARLAAGLRVWRISNARYRNHQIIISLCTQIQSLQIGLNQFQIGQARRVVYDAIWIQPWLIFPPLWWNKLKQTKYLHAVLCPRLWKMTLDQLAACLSQSENKARNYNGINWLCWQNCQLLFKMDRSVFYENINVAPVRFSML